MKNTFSDFAERTHRIYSRRKAVESRRKEWTARSMVNKEIGKHVGKQTEIILV